MRAPSRAICEARRSRASSLRRWRPSPRANGSTRSSGLAVLLPDVPFVGVVGFVGLPGLLLAAVALITLAYVLATKFVKAWFYRRAI